MAVSQRLRWAIFQRDNFSCQYCGRNIHIDQGLVLEIDHIKPISKGGTDDIDNLVTSCYECNHGKSADKSNIFDLDEVKNKKNKKKKIERLSYELDVVKKELEQKNSALDDWRNHIDEYPTFSDFCEKNNLNNKEAFNLLQSELIRLGMLPEELIDLKNNIAMLFIIGDAIKNDNITFFNNRSFDSLYDSCMHKELLPSIMNKSYFEGEINVLKILFKNKWHLSHAFNLLKDKSKIYTKLNV